MKRYIKKQVLSDLNQKIVLLTGPRQVGKTTFAKQCSDACDYFNYDLSEDRLALQEKSWDRSKELVIFDELYKKQDWKRWIKGIYDTESIPPKLMVTGSARLDTYKKVGDSLAGRYFQHRLHPLDVKEAVMLSNLNEQEAFERIWYCSGFPEPFMSDSERSYKRWRRGHLDIILRQDLIDMHSVADIKAIETLVLLLRGRVGSTISYANLARDIEKDPTTVKRWLQMLEDLYIIFKVTPYHKNISRSLLKEPKYYFYDVAYANDEGAKLENMVAAALLKELHFLEDTEGVNAGLHYLRTKDGKELDFLVCIDQVPTHVIEVKTSDPAPSKAFQSFAPFLGKSEKLRQIQLVRHLKRESTYPGGVEVRALIPWLSQLQFDNL